MYSLEQLIIFVTVCETGSFSAAARKLNRAQSGVSQAIASLEIAINQELFNREKNTPILTSNGEALLPIAKSILSQKIFFDQKIQALDQDYEHEIVIAMDDSLLNHSVLAKISSFADRFPITQFDIVVAPTFDVENHVREGKAHLGIVLSDGELKDDMEVFTLGQMRFLTVVSPKHSLASLSLVYDFDLKQHRQLVLRGGKHQELSFGYGISSKLWFANSHHVLANLACQGIGWSLLPEPIVKEYIDKGKLVALPVAHELNGWFNHIGGLVNRSKSAGPVLQQLVKELRNCNFDEKNGDDIN